MGKAGRGAARRREAGQDEAGEARRGEVRHGPAGRGLARQANQLFITNQFQGAFSMKKKYQFKKGCRVRGVKPDVAAKELARIRKKHKRLTPSSVVKEAEPEDAPLHPAFEWDDSEAANQYRLQQARSLIRVIAFTDEDEPDKEPTTVYVHVPGDEPRYEPMEVVIADVDMFRLSLNALTDDLRSAQKACSELRRMQSQNVKLEAAGSHIDAAVSELVAV